MDIIIRLLVSAVAVMLAAWLLPGVSIRNFWTAVFVAIILAFLNAFVKPIMVFLTIPFTVFTFGLFLFVINALIILLTSYIIEGFRVEGFWWALLFSLILSLIQYIFGLQNSIF